MQPISSFRVCFILHCQKVQFHSAKFFISTSNNFGTSLRRSTRKFYTPYLWIKVVFQGIKEILSLVFNDQPGIHIINIAKGTTDPRVEFISQVLTQILMKFHLLNLVQPSTKKSQTNISISTKLKLQNIDQI